MVYAYRNDAKVIVNYNWLDPFFDRTFIADSYSCRRGKGTHKAMERFRSFAYAVSRNHTRTCWILKCDIRKFFASIDQQTLFDILARYIPDERLQALIAGIVRSFHSTQEGKGLPLGNLTSQLLVNVYMNEFDRYVKHALKAKHYVRYADDFVFLSHNRQWLISLIPQIADFLETRLMLSLHPRKVSISTLASGVDFLGWLHFPDHRMLRTATKRRMLRRLAARAGSEGEEATRRAFLGLLSHGNAHRLKDQIAR